MFSGSSATSVSLSTSSISEIRLVGFLSINTVGPRSALSGDDYAVSFQEVEESFGERFNDSGPGRKTAILRVP